VEEEKEGLEHISLKPPKTKAAAAATCKKTKASGFSKVEQSPNITRHDISLLV